MIRKTFHPIPMSVLANLLSNPIYENWTVSKPCVPTSRGVVSSHHPYASAAGIWALEQGGNACDAAIATALSLCIHEPWASGLGGGGFAMFYEACTKKTHALSFEMPSPMDLNPQDYPTTGGETTQDIFAWAKILHEVNRHGPKSSGIPGAVKGYAHALQRFGNLDWKTILTPSVEAANKGHLITWWSTLKAAEQAHLLRLYPESASIWLPNNAVPCMSEQISAPKHLCLNHLAKTFLTLQQEGPESFYTGKIADQLLEDITIAGGYWSAKDLASYQPLLEENEALNLDGYQIHTPDGLCAGPDLKKALSQGPKQVTNESERLVAMAKTLRSITKARLSEQGHAHPPKHSQTSRHILSLETPCTSNVSVVDAQGNMAVITTTLLSVFGSKFTSKQSGILLNNALYWFHPDPKHPNGLKPNAKPLTNMCPCIVLKDKRPFLGLGASGGRRIMPAVYQALHALLYLGIPLDQALAQARVDTSEMTRIIADPRISQSTVKALQALAPVDIERSIANPNPYAVITAVAQTSENTREGACSPNFPLTSSLAQES